MSNNDQPGYEEIGALWLKKSKTGDAYYSGQIEVYTPSGEHLVLSLTIFVNKAKVTDKQPHALVFTRKFPNDVPF